MTRKQRTSILRRMLCSDCGVNVGNYGPESVDEYAYMVRDDVWPDGCRFLCVGCLEHRLGRELVREDFDWRWPINWASCFSRSTRLKSRLGLSGG